jgi:hypothetical protein
LLARVVRAWWLWVGPAVVRHVADRAARPALLQRDEQDEQHQELSSKFLRFVRN